MPVNAKIRALLEPRRDALNLRFQRLGRDLPPNAFLDYLERTVAPLIERMEDGVGEAALLALFDLGLVGMRHGLVGEREATAFERSLSGALSRFGVLWRSAPQQLVRAVGNGFARIEHELGEPSAVWWLDTLAAAAPWCVTREALLDVGLVLGWRAGLAEARDAALARASTMAPDLVSQIFGSPAIDARTERRFCAPGSTRALGDLEIVARLGGFAGFGGAFLAPPRVAATGDRLLASDGNVVVELHADVFGARVRPVHDVAVEVSAAEAYVAPAMLDALPELRGATSLATAASMTAVTLGDSHLVFILGRKEVAA